MTTLKSVALLLAEDIKLFRILLAHFDGFCSFKLYLIHGLSTSFMLVPIKNTIFDSKKLLLLLDLNSLCKYFEPSF